MHHRIPQRICISIHTRAEAIRAANPNMLATEAKRLAKEEYDRRWKRKPEAATVAPSTTG